MRRDDECGKCGGWISASLFVTILLVAGDALSGPRTSHPASICHPHHGVDFGDTPDVTSATEDVHPEQRGDYIENDTETADVNTIRLTEVISCPLPNTRPGSPHSITSVAVYGKTGALNDPAAQPLYTCFVVSTQVNDQTGEVEVLEAASGTVGPFNDKEVFVKLNIPVTFTASWGVYTLMCRLPPADSRIYSYTVEQAS
jgi:hypothetical protein